MDFNGVYTEVATFNTSTARDVETVDGIAFAEGTGAPTTSTKAVTSLLIEKNNQFCLTGEGLCGDNLYIGYRIEFPTLRVTEVRKGDQDALFTLWSLKNTSWNATGDKAFARVNCPEGCPEAVLISYDLKSGTEQILLTESDLVNQSRFTIEPIWFDDDTVMVLDTKIDL